MRDLHLLYINVIEENAGWGAEWFMNKALREAGCQTWCLDYVKHRHQLYRPWRRIPAVHAALLQRGDYFPLPLLHSLSVPRFFWASELVSRCRDQDRLLRSGLFEHIFMRTQACIDEVVARGWVPREKLSIFGSAFDPALHRPLPAVQPDVDVLFVGAVTPRRERILSRLQAMLPVRIVSAYGEDMVHWFNRAHIILNIHADDYLDTETRVYEVLGCRKLLLTETLSPENPFDKSELVEWFNLEDLADKIRYYLAHVEAREDVANKGYQAALANHTYAHRAQTIIAQIRKSIDYRQLPQAPVHYNAPLYIYGVAEPSRRLATWTQGKARGALRRVRRLLARTEQ